MEITITVPYESPEGEQEYEVVAEVEPYVQGRYSGPPENCFPSEGGYASIIEVRLGQSVVKAPPLDFPSTEELEAMVMQKYQDECEAAAEAAAEDRAFWMEYDRYDSF